MAGHGLAARELTIFSKQHSARVLMCKCFECFYMKDAGDEFASHLSLNHFTEGLERCTLT